MNATEAKRRSDAFHAAGTADIEALLFDIRTWTDYGAYGFSLARKITGNQRKALEALGYATDGATYVDWSRAAE